MHSDISEAAIFRGMDPGTLEEIRKSGYRRRYPRGEFLFLEGGPGDELFILLEGRVKLSKSSEEGREVTVKFIEPPENFAEIVLFESTRYPVTAQAVEDSTVFSLSRGRFLRLLEEKRFRDGFIAMLMKKQRYLAERILYLTSYDVEERFFRFLLDNYGRQERYEIPIPRKDIASAIGTIPETLSRLVARLRSSGTLDWEGDILTLPPSFWDDSNLDRSGPG
ncbi:MAG TPA: Crp/Fnr family transcriptional regulator [Candidatus Krumholzibacterium sp.]|nr:Crp/Fnr family transcriptional regulator [Candidatus Krumholzibacterium sp.]